MTELEILVGDHYYTASSSRGGLATIDVSDFISKEEISQLEDAGVYRTAYELNPNAQPEIIVNLFPTNKAYLRLSTGRQAFLNAVYIGKGSNTLDRPGNYFTHSIVVKESSKVNAAMIFDQVNFRSSVDVNGDHSQSSKLSERAIVVNYGKNCIARLFEEYSEALRLDEELRNLFSELIDVIVSGWLLDGRRIAVCFEKDRVERAILAMNFLLPEHISCDISFATYVNHPEKYKYQISGVIPECGITKLNTDQFKFIDGTRMQPYQAKELYTNRLLELVTRLSGSGYDEWQQLNSDIKAWRITEMGPKLNAPIILREFITNIESKTWKDLKDLRELGLPDIKWSELLGVILERNRQLYLDYTLEDLIGVLQKTSSRFDEQWEVFIKLYRRHYEPNDQLRREFLLQFVEGFRDLSSREKNAVSVFVLKDCDLRGTPEQWQSGKWNEADYWFDTDEVDEFQRIEMAGKLTQQYRLDMTFYQNFKNILRFKTLNDLREEAAKGDFFKFEKSQGVVLVELKEKHKCIAFFMALHNENIKGRFDLSFSKYIRIITKYFGEKDVLFWRMYFEGSKYHDPKNEFNRYALAYQKKRFIIAVFESELRRPELATGIGWIDNNSLWWIEEELVAIARKQAVLQEFYEVFEADPQTRSYGWNPRYKPAFNQ